MTKRSHFLAPLAPILAPLAIVVALPACKEQEMSRGEASTAVSEAALESDAHSVVSTSIEISTNFTIGKALADAAAELRAFIATEAPCAKLTLSGNTLTTEWGEKTGCNYHGMTFTGTSQITISRDEDGSVEVDHVWTDMSNGRVKVSGTANVTWSKANASRHVVHDLSWTRLSDGKTGHGKGDRTQHLLDPSKGLAGGIGIDGNRSWTNAKGTWNLAITGVELRVSDPCPEAGTYTLSTPENKLITIEFTRRDETTIVAEVSAGKMHFSFVVHTAEATVADA
jgi:hypothetical protein